MSRMQLRRMAPGDVHAARIDSLDAETRSVAARILEDVRLGGEPALRKYAEKFGDLAPASELVIPREALELALEEFGNEDPEAREVLERTAARIRTFAEAQRAALQPMELRLPGARAGHSLAPVETAGCYAPGGRYPLPSSVLMTAITARVAGVQTVWVASPRPQRVTLAAAAVAGADALLSVGGAQAIAAFAYGSGQVPACDTIVGPGNRFVTAAKELVAGRVAIDMLAGPSEILVLADGSADPALIAADLLAQAEHDPDARAMLLSTSNDLVAAVEHELDLQLRNLPTADIARAALGRHGMAICVDDLGAAVALANRLAPEHLEVLTAHPEEVGKQLQHYGALFLGAGAAEVFGDYGIGPNHVLPTGSGARSAGGLSVFTFLRVRTWLSSDSAPSDTVIQDAARLARLEGLEAHARAAERRQGKRSS